MGKRKTSAAHNRLYEQGKQKLRKVAYMDQNWKMI